MKGFTDKPLSGKAEDIFGVTKYITGLSNFILDCDTPMTVAVQGDWGSGKTSFMMLIREEIEKRVLPIWFNTWQFSQFNLGERLPIMLVSRLSAALGVKDSKGEELKGSLKTLAGALFHLGLSTADKLSGLDISGAAKELMPSEGEKDLTEVLSKLRSQFQECVEQALKEQRKDRVVIFVDDLDRLQPARAVELLEVLKLFLDCDNCVFILAIDYEVVSQGIRQKYGETLAYDKGRSFFDKIIQVPFKMPVAHYDVEKYVKTALERMDLAVSDAGPYVDLIKASIGYNPRGMKRLLNAFLLLQRIHSGEQLSEEYEKRLLFAVLCLQLSYEEVYNFVVRNSSRLEPVFYKQLADPECYEVYLRRHDEGGIDSVDDLEPALAELFDEWGLDERLEEGQDIGRMTAFMESFCSALTDESGELTSDGLNRLGRILNFSAVTAAEIPLGNVVAANSATGKGIRYENELDPVASYHAIDEPIVFNHAKKLPGWNNSVIESFSLFGQEEPVEKYGDLLCRVLTALYRRKPEVFMEVRKNAQSHRLATLFQGSKGSFKNPATLPGTDIQVETYSSTHQKITDIRKLMEAMGFEPGELKLCVRLARRVHI